MRIPEIPDEWGRPEVWAAGPIDTDPILDGGYGDTMDDSLDDGQLTNDSDEGPEVFDDDEAFAAAADSVWLAERVADAYDTGDPGDVPVPVPSPAEMDVRGVLEAAGPRERVARMTEQLPEIGARLIPRPAVTDVPAYDECVLEHQTLEYRSAAALQQLVDTMPNPVTKENKRVFVMRSYVPGAYALEDGTTTEAVVDVSICYNVDGLYDQSGHGAIQAHTVSNGLPLLSMYEQAGISAGDTDLGFKPVEINAMDISPGYLEHIAERVGEPVRREAWAAAVQPWVESYMQLPQPIAPPPRDEDYGLRYIPDEVKRLLAGGETDPQQVVDTLRAAYGGDVSVDDDLTLNLQETLGCLVPDGALGEVLAKMDEYGVTERYAWMLQHAEEIHAAAMDAERDALAGGLKQAYDNWRTDTEGHIGRLEALAHNLERLQETMKEKPLVPLPEPTVEKAEKMAQPIGVVPAAFHSGIRRF